MKESANLKNWTNKSHSIVNKNKAATVCSTVSQSKLIENDYNVRAEFGKQAIADMDAIPTDLHHSTWIFSITEAFQVNREPMPREYKTPLMLIL